MQMSKLNICFVDDEPHVLSGLQRSLRGQRHEWDMSFHGGAGAALQAMRETPCDILVTDFRMPKMNGAELLAEVKGRYPEVVRIVLSGQAELDAAVQSVKSAHQFLTKPCTAETLKAVIDKAHRLRQRLANPELESFVSSVTTLPSLPALYFRITEEIESPTGSLQNIGKIIAQDLSMSAKLLQMVNSSYFGVSHEISSVSHAVNYLGVDLIRTLIMSAEIFASADNQLHKRFDLEGLWLHSFQVSNLAHTIAELENCDNHVCEYARIAGMLHDVGKLILVNNQAKKFQQAIDLAAATDIPVWVAEEQVFGCSHADVGAYLLGIWGLPDPVVEAISYHHTPGESLDSAFSPTILVHCADALIHQQTPGCKEGNLDMENLTNMGINLRVDVWHQLLRDDPAPAMVA